MKETTWIVERLGSIFVGNLRIDVPSPDIDLFETGTLDSLQLVELLLQIEQQFGVSIAIDDIELDDLRTLERISNLILARGEDRGLKDAGSSSRAALSLRSGGAR